VALSVPVNSGGRSPNARCACSPCVALEDASVAARRLRRGGSDNHAAVGDVIAGEGTATVVVAGARAMTIVPDDDEEAADCDCGDAADDNDEVAPGVFV
jgi:hypothetical protein